jgi:hypothetical protein
MVQEIRREIKIKEEKRYEIDSLGVNSKGIFTIACKDGILLNFLPEEAEKVKNFLNTHGCGGESKVILDKDQMPKPNKKTFNLKSNPNYSYEVCDCTGQTCSIDGSGCSE